MRFGREGDKHQLDRLSKCLSDKALNQMSQLEPSILTEPNPSPTEPPK